MSKKYRHIALGIADEIAQQHPLRCIIATIAILVAGCGGTGSTTPARPPLLDLDSVHRAAVTIAPLDQFNSPANEFGLTMPLDSTIVFFTSSRGESKEQGIFCSRQSNGAWGEPTLAVVVNNEFSNGVPSITPGGESMYFAGDEYGFGDCDIYRVDVGPRGGVPEETIPWSVPNNLGLRVNGTYWDSEPCISADGSMLYFASDRPAGFGGRDIWVCRRGRDGAWERPINAGEAINTSFDEVSPWVSPDNQTLFFSSNGHPGLGGFDIFMATDIGGVTIVRHLGAPINSRGDDICFTLSAAGERAFLSSNRPEGKGGYDLYAVRPVPVAIDPLMIVSGQILGKDGKPLIATVEVSDLTSGQMVGRFITDPETGRYRVVLPRGYNYAITAQAPDYLFSSRQVVVPRDIERNMERTVDFSLEPIRGVIRLLVFFDPNESNLKRESRNDLDRAVSFLMANPDIDVEIAGHSDNSGDAKAAVELSRERAQAVKSYLVGNRIQGDRIKVVGYGSTQPITSNDTDEGRAMNRRVEMRVIEPR